MRESECYIGKKVGRLTLVEPTREQVGKHNYGAWVCKCDCGNMVTRMTCHLGEHSSCGCYKKELVQQLHKNNVKAVDKLADSNDKSPWLPLYNKFRNMHTRCENPNYAEYDSYGKRGIHVCAEWEDYETFKKWALSQGYTKGSGRSQTIDRIDVNKGYSPENCRLVNMYVQANNKTNNVYITYKGIKKTLAEWSRVTGINIGTLQNRLSYGWDNDELLKSPIEPTQRNRKAIMVEDVDGKRVSLSELARRHSLSISTVLYRYNHGIRGKDLIKKPR